MKGCKDMNTVKNRICIKVTPRKNDRKCFIEWGDGSRSICINSGTYWHTYEKGTSDYVCNIVNAYDFSIGSGDSEDYSKEMVKSIPILGDGLGRITDGLYYGLDVKTLKIPDSVESIGASAFCGCSSLENINFPPSISSIGEYAFDGCVNLFFEHARLESLPLTSIPEACFRRCLSIMKISIPQSVTTIGASAFYAASPRIHDFPKNIIDIGDYAFYFSDQYSLLDDNGFIYFDSHVNRIGDCAFLDSWGLKGVKFKEGIDYIGNSAFQDCEYLTSVEFSGAVGTIASSCFLGCGRLGSTELPSRIRRIEDSAFMFCENLSSVQENGVVADSLESIGASAFYNRNYHYLSSFSVGDSLTSIGDYAFANCQNLSSFNLGNNLAEIGSHSFEWCSKLFVNDDGKLRCPEKLRKIGEYAFSKCESITSAEFNDYIDKISNGLFLGSSIVFADIGNNIRTIEKNSFRECKKLENVILGNSVRTIESYAFSQCSKLKEVILPNSVNKIKENAFSVNTSLTSINFPNSLISIGKSAFASSKLHNIYLNEGLKEIGDNCFRSCGNNGGTVVIPSTVSSIGLGAFSYSKYDRIDIDSSSSLEKLPRFCFGNSSISICTLPNNLIEIGRDCFSSCRKLSSIKLPIKLSSIKTGAFVLCSSLKYLEFESQKAPWNEDNYVFGKSEQNTWAGYGVRGSNKIVIPHQPNSGYIIRFIGSMAIYEPWLRNLLTNGGFIVEIKN